MSDISYSGPTGGFVPQVGENLESIFVPAVIGVKNGYADVAGLRSNLSDLIAYVKNLVGDLELDLQNNSLTITSDPSDDRLRAAHLQEWPISLGAPKDFITYRYYKSLESKTTASASYIRDRYEQAARDVTGTNSIDFLPLANIILGEGQLIQEFLTRNISTLDDSAESRTVEHFQDWVQDAVNHAGLIRGFFEQDNSQRLLPSSETDSLNAAGASNAQALFKVNLNKLNADLVQGIEFLTRNFSKFAGTFYNNFLTPALNFRQNVTSNITPIYGGRLGVEMSASHRATDKNLSTILADQIRRNQLFAGQMTQIENNINLRDNYRTYILQLAIVGTALAAGAPGTTINATDAPAEVTYFDTASTSAPIAAAATPNYGAPHSQLSDLADPNAHSQYLLKNGDTLTGNLGLSNGATIDGVVPHAHSHSGVDGTQQIHGSAIIPGSVNSNTINLTAAPSIPYGLKVLSQTVIIIPPGTPGSSTILSWEGDPSNTYEVQYFSTALLPSPQVTNVTAIAGNASATVMWTVPPNGVNLLMSFIITPYIGVLAQPPIVINGPWSTSSVKISNLMNGTDYTFTVIYGNSTESSHSNIIRPYGAPVEATNVIAKAHAYATATISWTVPIYDGGQPITMYKVTPYIGTVPQTPIIVSP